MIEWTTEWTSPKGSIEVLAIRRDGELLGMVSIDYTSRAFVIGHHAGAIPHRPGAATFLGRGWKTRLVQAAKNTLSRDVKF